MAVAIERQFGVDDFIETLAVGGEVFQPVAGPFDRAPQPPCSRANKNFLRIERALAAKTAADVRRNDADAVARNIERGRKRIADDAGHLRRRMQRQRIAARLVFGETGARLDRDRALAMHAEPAFDLDRHRGKCRVWIAAFELAADYDVCASLLVQQRRAGTHRLLRIDHNRQRFVVDGDELKRVLGVITAVGNDADDRLADIAHLVLRQRQDRRGVIMRHARGRDQRLDRVA